jgi:hypothetical protein
LNPDQIAPGVHPSTRGSVPLPAARPPAKRNVTQAAKPAPASKPDPATAHLGYTGKTPNVKRVYRAGVNQGEIEFESPLQRDLYDLGAKQRYAGRGGPDKTHQRPVGDIEGLKKGLAQALGVSENTAARVAMEVHEDVKAQMKGLKDGESRKVAQNVDLEIAKAEDKAAAKLRERHGGDVRFQKDDGTLKVVRPKRPTQEEAKQITALEPPPPDEPVSPLRAMVKDEDAVRRLRRTLSRDPEIGAPRNPRTVLKNKEGRTYILGPQRPADWTAKAEKTLTASQIAQAARWYDDLPDFFREHFPEMQPDVLLRAWMAANQQETPSGAFRNVLRALDVVRGNPVIKRSGLAHDAVVSILKGEVPKGGLSDKLVDFIDSGLGKSTRTWMGDDPRGGRPAVIDIWTGRDAGFVDGVTLHWLEREGFRITGLHLDGPYRPEHRRHGFAPDERQYEWASRWLNDLTDTLNKQRWLGRSDWTPAQLQAVGWIAKSVEMGGAAEFPIDIILKNTRRVSFELAFGDHSPYAQRFPSLYELPFEKSLAITRQATTAIVERVLALTGAKGLRVTYGPGGYLDYPAAPSGQLDILASPEGVEDVVDLLGLALQQTEVWAARPMSSGSHRALDLFEVDGSQLKDPDTASRFWNRLRELGPESILQGFQPIEAQGRAGVPDGSVGIRIIQGQDAAGKKRTWSAKDLQAFEQAVVQVGDELGITDLDLAELKLDLHAAKNDWKENPNGKAYKQGLAARGRSGLLGGVDDLIRHSERAIAGAYRDAGVRFQRDEGAAPGAAAGGGGAGAAGASGDRPRGRRSAHAVDAPSAGRIKANLIDGAPGERLNDAGRPTKRYYLTHYRSQFQPVIQPKERAGKVGAEGKRLLRTEVPAPALNYYYVGNSQPETFFWRKRQHHLVADLAIYDLAADPLGLKERVIAEQPADVELRINRLEQLIQEAGFDGYQSGAQVLTSYYPLETNEGGTFTPASTRPGPVSLQEEDLAALGVDEGPLYRRPDGTLFQREEDAKAQLEERHGPVWYSQAERVLGAMPGKRATVEQVNAALAKGGVKPEELEWTGIAEFLEQKQRAGEPVFKAELEAFARENRVVVQEVVKGLKPEIPEWAETSPGTWTYGEHQIRRQDNGRYLWRDRAARMGNIYETLAEAQADAEMAISLNRADSGDADAPKYAQYVLPGGENYRELLFTLPERKKHDEMAQHLFGRHQRTLSHEEFQAVDRAVKAQRQPSEAFRSTHWDEPNVLAHVRFNERVDTAGQRTLLIEEIQSDWHQEGRKKGYKKPGETFQGFTGQIEALEARHKELVRQFPDPSHPERVALREEHARLLEARRSVERRPPDAPFRKSWPDLVLKRMLRWAAENGFDQVAWAPGKVQADRYKLTNHIDTLIYDEQAGILKASLRDQKVFEREVAPEQLGDYVGQDVAARLLSPQSKERNSSRYILQGLDLETGGEGMKGFYDDILPKAAQKLGKRWGAQVGRAAVWLKDPAEDGAKIVSSSHPSEGPFQVRDTDNRLLAGGFASRADAELWLGGTVDAPSLPVTREMRESVLQGQPLFQRERVKPTKADLEDLSEIGAVYYARGLTDRALWDQRMLSQWGDGLKPHLNKLWTRSQQRHEQSLKAVVGGPGKAQVEAPTPLERQMREAGTPEAAAGSVNLSKLNVPDDVKTWIAAETERLRRPIQLQRRFEVSDADADAAAERLIADGVIDAKKLRRAAKPGTTFNKEELTAIGKLHVSAGLELLAAQENYALNATPENLARLGMAKNAWEVMHLTTQGASAEAGRSLQALKALKTAVEEGQAQATVAEMFNPRLAPGLARGSEKGIIQPEHPKWASANRLFNRKAAQAALKELQAQVATRRHVLFQAQPSNTPGPVPRELIEYAGALIEGGIRQRKGLQRRLAQDGFTFTEDQIGRLWEAVKVEARRRARQEERRATAAQKHLERVLEDHGVTPELAAEIERRKADPVALNTWLRDQTKMTIGDQAKYYYRSSLTSGLKTHLKNVVSTGTMHVLRLPETVITGAVDSLVSHLPGRDREYWAGEVVPVLAGYRIGLAAGLKDFATTFRHGLSEEAARRMDVPRGEPGGGLKNPWVVNMRLQGAEDAFNKALQFHASAQQLAWRQAYKVEGLRGRALDTRVKELLSDENILDQAWDEAHEYTFNEKPDALLRMLLGARQKAGEAKFIGPVAGPVAWLTIPFLSTPYNVVKTTAKYSPLGLVQGAAELYKGEQGASRTLGRAITGTLLFIALGQLLSQVEMTGGVPRDEGMREAFYREGNQPYSLKVAGRSLSYAGLGPLTAALAVIAAWKNDKWVKDEPTFQGRAVQAAIEVGKVFKEMPFLTGLNALVDALDDPERYGEALAARTLSGILTPGAVAHLADMGDPLRRDTKGVDALDTIGNKLKARVPGLQRTLPARVDALGRDVARDPGGLGALQPFIGPAEKKEAVDKELIRLKVFPALPEPKLTVGEAEIRLNPEETRIYRKMAGEQLYRSLSGIVAHPAWQQSPKQAQKEALEDAISQARKDGAGQMRAWLVKRGRVPGVNPPSAAPATIR